MKKSRLLALIFVFVGMFSVFSQSIFDKFEDNDEVTTVVVSQKMFEMFSKIQTNDAEAQEFMEMAKKLTGLKVFTTNNPKISEQIKSAFNSYLKDSSLRELMRVKSDGGNVKFFFKEGKDVDTISELFMFVNGNDSAKSQTVLLTLTGEIDLNKISTLTSKMNLPSELNEVKKKK